MAAPVESLDEPAHTGELVRRLREAAGLSVAQVAVRAGIVPERLQALEAGEGVSELGYAEVCALVRATQPPRRRRAALARGRRPPSRRSSNSDNGV